MQAGRGIGNVSHLSVDTGNHRGSDIDGWTPARAKAPAFWLAAGGPVTHCDTDRCQRP